MNRRAFVSRVTLGGVAAAYTGFGRPAQASTPNNQVNVRFIGMMTFMERADRSFLVATPGQHALHHMTHTPFLMARRGSALAQALDLKPAPGVVPAAFDTGLIGSNPGEFVYRSLDNTALDIVSGEAAPVTNLADEMALMNRIAPNKRVRGNVEKWAGSTVSLRGGQIENSAGHPDAHKVWTFGAYQQRLTDAVNFRNVGAASTTIRLTSAVEARSFTARSGEAAELWVISAAQPGEADRRADHARTLRGVVRLPGRRDAGCRNLPGGDRQDRASHRAAIRASRPAPATASWQASLADAAVDGVLLRRGDSFRS